MAVAILLILVIVALLLVRQEVSKIGYLIKRIDHEYVMYLEELRKRQP